MDRLVTLGFIFALALSAATRLWLARRQIRHLRACRDTVPADFADAVPLEAHRKAADYGEAKARLAAVELAIGVATLLALTLGGGLQRLADVLAGGFDPAGLWHGTALIAAVALIVALVELPTAVWRTFVVEARFGFNLQTRALFAADLARQLVIGAALGLPLAFLVLWLMLIAGQSWWIYAWFVWAVFNIVVLLLYPTVIAPLFNRFSPLAEPELARRVEALLARCGFRSNGLYVMDGSKRSSHGNAYFTGFGAAKRIVFFDTLISRLDADQIEAVLAHELGHYRLRHIAQRIALMFAISFALLWVLGRLGNWPPFFAGLGVGAPSHAMALLLFVLVLPAFTFPLQPALSLLSRHHEYEADAYAARHASARALREALVRLYRDNATTLTPDPLYSAFHDSHPPAAARIARLQEVSVP